MSSGIPAISLLSSDDDSGGEDDFNGATVVLPSSDEDDEDDVWGDDEEVVLVSESKGGKRKREDSTGKENRGRRKLNPAAVAAMQRQHAGRGVNGAGAAAAVGGVPFCSHAHAPAFFLNHVSPFTEDSPPNAHARRFSEVIGLDRHGGAQAVVFFDYVVDPGFLFNEALPALCSIKRVVIVHDHRQDLAVPLQNVCFGRVRIKANKFGTHHTKLVLVKYKGGSVRLIVHTANLMKVDICKMTQVRLASLPLVPHLFIYV